MLTTAQADQLSHDLALVIALYNVQEITMSQLQERALGFLADYGAPPDGEDELYNLLTRLSRLSHLSPELASETIDHTRRYVMNYF